MKVDFHKSFDQQFKRLPTKQQAKIKQALRLFIQDSHDPILRSHPLKGKWLKHRSISAGGDLRLHYRAIDDNTVLFVAIGNHSQLYR